jgi:hypothetical protein
LKITLKGELAGMLSAARDSKRSPETGDLLLQIKLVAGARNQQHLAFCWAGIKLSFRITKLTAGWGPANVEGRVRNVVMGRLMS